MCHVLLLKVKEMSYKCPTSTTEALQSNEYLPSVLLPGEERSRHEEAVQTPEVQPAEGGEVGEEGQQRRLCDAAPRQGQALQLRAQAQTHLERERERQHTPGWI